MQFSLNTIQNKKTLHSRKDTKSRILIVINQAMSQSTANIRWDPYHAANVISFVSENLKVLAFLNNLEIYTDD